jgi:organic hydroperoxide reductase OsmC/OhrA
MGVHRASVDWRLGDGEDFLAGRYSRGHAVRFEGGHEAPGSASAQVVGNRWAVPGAVDPEEMLVAAISACHMLSFLHVARIEGLVAESYRDEGEGMLEPNAEGRLAVTRVVLRPQIAWRGRAPTPAELDRLHHAAHEACFIASSVKTDVVVESR